MITYLIDSVQFFPKSQICEVRGWATDSEKNDINLNVVDESHEKSDQTFRRTIRRDIALKNNPYSGFVLSFSYTKNKKYFLELITKTDKVKVPIETGKKAFNVLKLVKAINVDNVKRAITYCKLNGFGATLRKLSQGYTEPSAYNEWFLSHKISEQDILKQKETNFSNTPLISVIVPTYNTPVCFLEKMLDSVLEQTYSNWELCIADASISKDTKIVLQQYSEKESRIKINWLKQNYGIAGNTNKAFEMAKGDYCGLLDHDDFLEPNALYEVVKKLNEFSYDCLYTDEDKFDSSKKIYVDPNFKPDFSIDALCSHNYITHFFVAKTELLKKVGFEHGEFDGAQDYDLILRCIEITNRVGHISKPVYHWRMYSGSTAENPAQKMYCYEAGKNALIEHFNRVGIEAEVEMMPKPYWGLYHVKYSTHDHPLVSIVIPNYENKKVLERCIDSLLNKNNYKNIEIVIVENNSSSSEIFEYYNTLEGTNENIRILNYGKHEFNYSAINNYGVDHCNGEYILLLNNDTEIINPDSIEEMLGICMREEVGVVGAKLLYPDNTVQHAGVLIGIEGTAAHPFLRKQKDDCGFMMRAVLNYNYSAVTGACLMTKKRLFVEVGGFDENLKVAFNDIDFCLKIRQRNKLVVYNAFSLWYHYESVSRGYENSIEKIRRLNNETSIFQEKWKNELNRDPYYNDNFKDDRYLFKV